MSHVCHVLFYLLYVGRVSLTLRHRLVCEIDRSKNGANGTSNPSKTRLPSDPNRDCVLSPDSVKPRKPSKFPSKLVISTEDLKMKMLVRLSLSSCMPTEIVAVKVPPEQAVQVEI